ncbi:MAG TPA: hypothetical protein VFA81_00215 [Burkholderiales bacterium]|nr:hypothetical protein [Burkholderiales bacterium]
MRTILLAVVALSSITSPLAHGNRTPPPAQQAVFDASAEAAQVSLPQLIARIQSLRTFKAESFEWQVEAQQIAHALRAISPSSERQKVVEAFKQEIGAFVRKDASIAAEERLAQSTDAWAQRVDRALSPPSIGMRAAAVHDAGLFVATVRHGDMRRGLADKLANESGLSESARKAGFDRLDFVNSATAEKWSYPLDGGKVIRAQVLQEVEARWALSDK